MTLSEIQVEKREDCFFVCNEYGPVGSMYDFYSGAKNIPLMLARNTFPFKNKRNKFKTQSEAEAAAELLRKHVKVVLAMPEKARVGASKYWRE